MIKRILSRLVRINQSISIFYSALFQFSISNLCLPGLSKLFAFRGNPVSPPLTQSYFSSENKPTKFSGKLRAPKETTPIDKAIFSKDVYGNNLKSKQTSNFPETSVNLVSLPTPIKVIRYESEDAIQSGKQDLSFKVIGLLNYVLF